MYVINIHCTFNVVVVNKQVDEWKIVLNSIRNLLQNFQVPEWFESYGVKNDKLVVQFTIREVT